ncbi:MAG: hypothetical protein RLW62_11650 [Gammaproteobacteria bacterium]
MLVTGATDGIGLATARALAAALGTRHAHAAPRFSSAPGDAARRAPVPPTKKEIP